MNLISILEADEQVCWFRRGRFNSADAKLVHRWSHYLLKLVALSISGSVITGFLSLGSTLPTLNQHCLLFPDCIVIYFLTNKMCQEWIA
jgi:hypothetical protein